MNMLSNSTCCFVGFQTISGVLDWVNKEVYLEPCQTSEMEPFVKIVRRFHSFTIFAESSFLDLGQGSEHAVEINLKVRMVMSNECLLKFKNVLRIYLSFPSYLGTHKRAGFFPFHQYFVNIWISFVMCYIQKNQW